MNEPTTRRWAAASGFVGLALGAAAVAFERPWPSTSAPDAFPAFLADARGAILAQSMLFVLSAAFFIVWVAALRGFMTAVEGGTGVISATASGAGLLGYGLSIVGQGPQITLTLPAQSQIQPEMAAVLTDLGYAMITVANVPIAVMFAAIAVLTLRTGGFPRWLGWLALVASATELLLSMELVDPTGPLAPQGWLSYLLYVVPIAWLIPATVVMVRGASRYEDTAPPPRVPASTSGR
jgi:hypothetical protein